MSSGHEPAHALQPATWERLKNQINAQELRLADYDWEFQPGGDESGGEVGQFGAKAARGWEKIRVGRHWEAQGHAALDGWASYRLRLKVPPSWQQERVFLTFTGVDDMYDLWLNGTFVCRRGDIATRQSTFSEKFSHDISAFARAGEELLITVRVYDWFGAGGIFQPVYLGTAPHSAEGDILSRGN